MNKQTSYAIFGIAILAFVAIAISPIASAYAFKPLQPTIGVSDASDSPFAVANIGGVHAAVSPVLSNIVATDPSVKTLPQVTVQAQIGIVKAKPSFIQLPQVIPQPSATPAPVQLVQQLASDEPTPDASFPGLGNANVSGNNGGYAGPMQPPTGAIPAGALQGTNCNNGANGTCTVSTQTVYGGSFYYDTFVIPAGTTLYVRSGTLNVFANHIYIYGNIDANGDAGQPSWNGWNGAVDHPYSPAYGTWGGNGGNAQNLNFLSNDFVLTGSIFANGGVGGNGQAAKGCDAHGGTGGNGGNAGQTSIYAVTSQVSGAVWGLGGSGGQGGPHDTYWYCELDGDYGGDGGTGYGGQSHTPLVAPRQLVSVQVVPANLTVYQNDTIQYTAIGRDAGGYLFPIYNPAWSTSNPSIATITSPAGLATAGNPGTATIQASYLTVNGSTFLNVANGTLGSPYTLYLYPNATTITAGQSARVDANVFDILNNPVVDGTLVSFSTSIGIVNPLSANTVGGIASTIFNSTLAGNATITATSGTVTNTTVIQVLPGAATQMYVVPSVATLPLGGNYQFNVIAFDQYNNPVVVIPAWSVVNTTVGVVSSGGLFTALAPGTTTLVANAGSLSANATVTVTAFPLSYIDITPKNLVVLNNSVTQYTVTGYDTNGTAVAVNANWTIAPTLGNFVPAQNTQNTNFTANTIGNATITAVSGSFTNTTGVTVALGGPALLTVNPVLLNTTVGTLNSLIRWNVFDAAGNPLTFTSTPGMVLTNAIGFYACVFTGASYNYDCLFNATAAGTGNLNGFYSGLSNTTFINVTTPTNDTIAPNVTIVQPMNITYNTTTIPVDINAVDNVAVASVWYNVLGGNLSFVGPTSFVVPGPGTYTINAWANDTSGNVGTAAPVTFTVLSNATVNVPPVAYASVDNSTPVTGQLITFNASASYDPDGFIVSYFWDFGDASNATGVTANHSYSIGGLYTATLTVTDNGTASNSTTLLINVSTPFIDTVAPTVIILSPLNATYNVTTIPVDIFATDNVAVTSTWFNWNGTNQTFAGITNITVPSNGTYTLNAFASDAAGNVGTDTVTFTVNTSASANVSNIPPVAYATADNYTPVVGQIVTLNASASYDPDNNTPLSYQWFYGDATNTTSLTTNAVVTHAYTATGVYTATMIVTDALGASNATSFNITVGAPASNATGNLYGFVTNSSGGPLNGALVQIVGYNYSALTNASGFYNITLPAGTYSVSASNAGYVTQTASPIVINANQSLMLNFALGRAGAFSGTVIDAVNGTMLSGALVQAFQSGTLIASNTTNGSGVYWLNDLAPGTYNLTATATGYGSVSIYNNLLQAGQVTIVNFGM
ncbi:MAG TPA: PKD domain-containing protein [Candidatus Norongarragalinales archaeon]|nr:PKD domain-containing protein [Candidatus Norongarragalinales archaeon]